jgi:hypothetical protein
MTRAVDRTPEGGACQELAPQVVDKYFQASGATERFQFMTAKAICGGCAVRAACLEEAIIAPPGTGVRAGESSKSLWALHARWMDEHADITELVNEALRRQKRLGGLVTTRALRAGQMDDVPLAASELGGAR